MFGLFDQKKPQGLFSPQEMQQMAQVMNPMMSGIPPEVLEKLLQQMLKPPVSGNPVFNPTPGRPLPKTATVGVRG